MSKTYLQVKDVDEFFLELHLKCKQKNSYSLLAILQEMAVTFDEVQKWAKTNENWQYILELCLNLCCLHLEDAELLGTLPEDKIQRYAQEHRSLIQQLKL